MGKCSTSTVYAKHVVLLLGQSISREGRQTDSLAKASRVLERQLCLRAGLSIYPGLNNMSGKSFGGRVRVDEKRRAEENLFVLVHSECVREV